MALGQAVIHFTISPLIYTNTEKSLVHHMKWTCHPPYAAEMMTLDFVAHSNSLSIKLLVLLQLTQYRSPVDHHKPAENCSGSHQHTGSCPYKILWKSLIHISPDLRRAFIKSTSVIINIYPTIMYFNFIYVCHTSISGTSSPHCAAFSYTGTRNLCIALSLIHSTDPDRKLAVELLCTFPSAAHPLLCIEIVILSRMRRV